MNRPGQPPQRPPALGPNPALAGPFRGGPYPSYGLPPRTVGVLPGGPTSYVPALQQPTSQRTSQAQGMIPQATPTPTFLPRSQSGFYGTGLGAQHQQPTGLQQQQQPPSTQPPQPNGTATSNPLSSHLPPPLNLTGNGPPSVPSKSEVSLDLNEFPALGSVSSNNPNSSGSNGGAQVTTSYASQAGTGIPLSRSTGESATGSTASTNNPPSQAREFTSDDFPALGNHSQSQLQAQDHPHPPGLNGFQHNSEHRQNLLGALGGSNTPGMLHLGGQQSRGVHPGFGQVLSDPDKVPHRNNFPVKVNQAAHAAAAAWSSSNSAPQTQPLTANPFNPPSTATQNGTHSSNPTQSSQSLTAPPGVPPPPANNTYNQPVQPQSQAPGHSHQSGGLNNTYTSNGDSAPVNAGASSPSLQSHSTHPQTPAQQILMSAADRWGLLGLLAMIKGVGRDMDGGLSSIGTDLGTMGLDMSFPGSLYPTFITPWADQSAAHSVEPDFHLPACYNVQPPPPGPTKASAFSDETLFFMFYSHPRDALQEVAAQELWNRNWRYHKELRLWITKETGSAPSQKVPGGEQGTYTIWDPENWTKERKEMPVLYVDLEEKNQPAFVHGPGLVLAQPVPQTSSQQQQTQQTHGQGQASQGQVQQGQRVSFPIGMGGL